MTFGSRHRGSDMEIDDDPGSGRGRRLILPAFRPTDDGHRSATNAPIHFVTGADRAAILSAAAHVLSI